MARYEIDDLSMLPDSHKQLSDENVDSWPHDFASRTRSTSIPTNYSKSYEPQPSFVGHRGPLWNERRTPFIKMSGPLYISHNQEKNFCQNQGVTVVHMPEHMIETFPSFRKMEQNDWSEDNYARKNEHLLRSRQLGMCNDPYCTTCPTFYKDQAAQSKHPKSSGIFDPQFHNALSGDAKGRARRFFSFLSTNVLGMMNPHTKVVQQWNQFLVISCLLAIFIDPLFFFLLSINQNSMCIFINWPWTIVIVVLRSITDFIFLLNMLLQFKLSYIAPESRVVGAGELVDHPKKIALNYLSGFFFLDLFIVLPLPQIMILIVIPRYLGISGANYAKNLLQTAVPVQYIPRLYRFLPLFASQSPSGFIFDSAWAIFFINIFAFILGAHVVGSCWYLFALQRVNQCLHNACSNSTTYPDCMEFIDCGRGDGYSRYNSFPTWTNWTSNADAAACFSGGSFNYGLYIYAVNLTAVPSIDTKYIYAFWWGLLQICSFAGNQTPSYFIWEVVFVIGVTGLGLLLFAFLIGNMQNFLQALISRRVEMSLRRRDVEMWMSNRHLPEELRRRVRAAERFNWAATRGVNEEMLLENFPENLQRDIRRHLFKFVKNIRIFTLMDEPMLDEICERLRQNTYIKKSKVLYRGGIIDKMVFIVRGKMESTGEDGITVPLCEGDVCGEELLTWCLENSSTNRDIKIVRNTGQRLVSNRTVECVTNVEAFSLEASDIKEVTSLFTRYLRNARVQGAIRYESPYWRSLAAMRIQVAWRYRKKCLSRSNTSLSQSIDQSLF